MNKIEWIKLKENLPLPLGEFGQLKIMYCEKGWATPFYGLITQWKDGLIEIYRYNQQNDKYVDEDYLEEKGLDNVFYFLVPEVIDRSI